MLDVVADVCGIHAQIAASAELQIGLRVDGITRDEVRRALWQERTLVKTYGLRGTIHLFPARELALWFAAFRSKAARRQLNRAELETLPPERRQEVFDAICTALDGRQLTHDELGAEVERMLGPWVGEKAFPAFNGWWPRWRLALGRAALEGLIVFGPNRGNRVSYVRTDQWLAPLPEVDGDAALREVCRRYLAAYGPVTHVEFARWFYTRPQAALELMQSMDLDEVEVEGWRAWLPAGDSTPTNEKLSTRAESSSVHLVPHYDCYVVGCFPREQLIPAHAPPELRKGTAAPFPVVLVDGAIGGIWRRQQRGKVLEVRVEPFVPMSKVQKVATQQQAERIGEILQTPVEFSFGAVEPRPHL